MPCNCKKNVAVQQPTPEPINIPEQPTPNGN